MSMLIDNGDGTCTLKRHCPFKTGTPRIVELVEKLEEELRIKGDKYIGFAWNLDNMIRDIHALDVEGPGDLIQEAFEYGFNAVDPSFSEFEKEHIAKCQQELDVWGRSDEEVTQSDEEWKRAVALGVVDTTNFDEELLKKVMTETPAYGIDLDGLDGLGGIRSVVDFKTARISDEIEPSVTQLDFYKQCANSDMSTVFDDEALEKVISKNPGVSFKILNAEEVVVWEDSMRDPLGKRMSMAAFLKLGDSTEPSTTTVRDFEAGFTEELGIDLAEGPDESVTCEVTQDENSWGPTVATIGAEAQQLLNQESRALVDAMPCAPKYIVDINSNVILESKEEIEKRTPVSDKGHSPLSPSNLNRLSKCPVIKEYKVDTAKKVKKELYEKTTDFIKNELGIDPHPKNDVLPHDPALFSAMNKVK